MIHVVGIGLDGAAGLTAPLRKLVREATLLVGSDRHLSYFADYSGDRLELADISLTLKQLRRQLQRWSESPPRNSEPPAMIPDETPASESARRTDMSAENPPDAPYMVVLVSGDPLFFGLGRLLLAELPAEKLVFHPHLSSIQLAFNRVKVPWQDARIISAHGRSLDELLAALREGAEKIAVLTDRTNTPGAIARLLLSLDLPGTYQFSVCENLGATDERVRSFPVGNRAEIAAIESETFCDLNVVVLVRRGEESSGHLDLENLPRLGLPDSSFLTFSDRPGLMTKREVRVLVLGELALQPNQIIWDVGAGTGSVSIEIGRLFPTSRVYAIEKTAAGISLIEQNCQRLQVPNVISIHGNAPDILDRLPVPHRIFIGGTGGHLRQILGFCGGHLADGGAIVLALATLEHLTNALTWVAEMGWEYRALQVNLSRSVPVAHLTRFSPLNPVTIVVISKPENP